MLNPVHPGRFLRTEIIEAYGLSVTEAARVLRVSRPTVSSLLNAKAELSGEMALRFEKAFGVDMDTRMRMQNSYDIARTRSREKTIRVEGYRPQPAAGWYAGRRLRTGAQDSILPHNGIGNLGQAFWRL